MKLNVENEHKFAFHYMLTLARLIDDDNAMLELYFKGHLIAAIKPQTNEYTTRRDILRRYMWEDYPNCYINPDGSLDCLVWVNNEVALIFDEFREYYI